MVTFDESNQQKRLASLRKEEEEELVEMLATSRYGIPYTNLSSQPIDNDALRLLEEKEARTYDVGAYKLVGRKVSLAVRSPVADGAVAAKAFLEKKGYEVTMVMASETSIQKIWGRYADLSYATQSRAGSLNVSASILEELSKTVRSIDDAVKKISESMQEDTIGTGQRVSRILEIILGTGIGLGASDIHVEPMEDHAELRFRLDGVLHLITTFDHETYHKINTRIKLLSGLKLTISSNPQDGRFSAFLGRDEDGVEINFRTSLIPGAYGESIVLRILNPKSIRVTLDKLGISAPMYEIFMREIQKPHGMVLLTGPTGSGKTTTLYSFLQKIFTPEIKIITIEDPVEYHLAGITQTQVDHKKGYTFLEGLRSALRQDPDVIMVGEIRDSETAKIGVESALTGHLVFSTLHTNNASGVIPRLIDLEVNPKILVSALSLSIAQRLCRTLCPDCKYERDITDEERHHVEHIWDTAVAHGKNVEQFGVKRDVTKLWSGKGCPTCNNTGYKGRIGIFECIQMDANIEKIIMQEPTERDIKALADKQGTLDMREDGMVKVLQGLTDFAEVASVVDLEDEK
ncbi:type II/IV secretion system protein [Candidatus Nomurabacteria bacterium]|nr:type II/IV secretion system protein [Candidatus Nomurabacteria bacterium]